MEDFKWLENAMTSNTTPIPYIVETSGQYDSSYAGWKAFNGTNISSSDCWSSNENNGWISFYIGDKYKIGGIAITSRVSEVTGAPKDFKVYCSNDNVNWVEVLYKTNEISWSSSEKRIYYFDKIINGKFIKLDVISNNGRVRLDVGQINIYCTPLKKRMVLQNDNSYYSLSENTLIHLPDNSHKNMILHGIEQSKEIQLDVPFTKHNYLNDTPVDGASGKVFTHDIGKINALGIREIKENKSFEPIFTWYETKMTSNNAPSPLVASASSENLPRLAWKAFQTYVTSTTIDDCWLTNSGETLGWIQLDFGTVKTISQLKMMGRNSSTGDKPMEFTVSGSNDGTNFTELQRFKQTIDWASNTERLFILNKSHSFRYYRINILNNNGHSVSGIARIQFGYKREVK
ncbi:discoidin domain-containing protein [Lysinibacillus sp. NPDC092081]|uniref:discoidin domain-containing protein n=1 Tax=Lysinibacillus sp. NPDC092081 TaxID=3364131 RepID=UPI0038157736